MLMSSKWETMWREFRDCSKNVINVPLPSQQAKKLLEDLKTSCCSPNKAVQLEALKCWEIYMNNQNLDDWKLNEVCYNAVRPLLSKKLQPLHKDIDICKLKLSLMWSWLVKTQSIIHLEGPQYILEFFLQSCLNWLSSSDGVDNEISILIFQLILALFEKDSELIACDIKMFPRPTTDILQSKKVFHRFADKLLNLFASWKKVKNKNIIIKLWKHFLERCEETCECIPIPIWHKVFKTVSQICSETSETIKDRLSFLHGCATILKSILSSSKFIDFGNLLTTPCEALLKKLIELCKYDSKESYDPEMFIISQEISNILSCESVSIGGFDSCIFVLNEMEEFSSKYLFWGIWCGLVYCYKIHLMSINKDQYTKIQTKFYRKLRGVATNFDLDKDCLDENSILEIQRHIDVLKITCMCTFSSNRQLDFSQISGTNNVNNKFCKTVEEESKISQASEEFSLVKYVPSNKIVMTEKKPSEMTKTLIPYIEKSNICLGKFTNVTFRKLDQHKKLLKFNFNLFKEVHTLDFYTKSSFERLYYNPSILFTNIDSSLITRQLPLQLPVSVNSSLSTNVTVPYDKTKVPPILSCVVELEFLSKSALLSSIKVEKTVIEKFVKTDTEVIASEKNKRKLEKCEKSAEEPVSTPLTRSKRRACEIENQIEEIESPRRKRRKSYEILVQEIVKKNQLRKTEKNAKKKRSPLLASKVQKPNRRKSDSFEKIITSKTDKASSDISTKVLEKPKKCKTGNGTEMENKKPLSGKMEDYFKIISKSSSDSKVEGITSCNCVPSKKRKNNLSQVHCVCLKKDDNEKKTENGWKQTSLKTMVNKKVKNKTNKMKSRGEDNFKAKKVASEPTEESANETSLFSSSPYKEVLHDHYYSTKIEFSNFQISDVLKESNKIPQIGSEKKESLSTEALKEKSKINKLNEKETKPKLVKKDCDKKDKKHSIKKSEENILLSLELKEKTNTEKIPVQNEDNIKNKSLTECNTEEKTHNLENCGETDQEVIKQSVEGTNVLDIKNIEKRFSSEEDVSQKKKDNSDNQIIEITERKVTNDLEKSNDDGKPTEQIIQENDLSTNINTKVEDTDDENKEVNSNKKRVRMLDSIKPSKKVKVNTEQQNGLTEELTYEEFIEKEKENPPIEGNIPKKDILDGEKTSLVLKGKDDVGQNLNSRFLKPVNETRSSRALRIIGLIPDSKKPVQVHFDSPRPKESSLKSDTKLQVKKGVNVDKYSRASRMLALLVDNVPKEEDEIVYLSETKPEDTCDKKEVDTPNVKTLASSLKSPKSIKKRRSIRFDESKNETILYETHTPPSDIFEEKEKWQEIVLRSSKLI